MRKISFMIAFLIVLSCLLLGISAEEANVRSNSSALYQTIILQPTNGIIVLSAEDAALAEAGLLDPYELVENITVPSNPDYVTESSKNKAALRHCRGAAFYGVLTVK